MKKMQLFYSFLFLCGSMFAQQENVTGDWYGILKAPGMQLQTVYHISKAEDGFTATFDSPDQGATGIPVSETTVIKDSVVLEMKNMNASYRGKLIDGEKIIGEFIQNGYVIPLELSRTKQEKEVVKRPQEPQKPYPYVSENVSFPNKKDKLTLAGTLTLPKDGKDFPAAILISGSGAQNRDEEILEHKPFLVISDYLTRHGIAVLRFDDRGTAESTGDFKSATTYDFKTDVEAAVAYLKSRKEIDAKKIGLIGHSEGGMIAPMVAAEDGSIDYIVLLAGPGVRGDELLLKQQELVTAASGTDPAEINKSLKTNKKIFELINTEKGEKLQKDLKKYLSESLSDVEIPKGESKEAVIQKEVDKITSPWWLGLIRYDPAPVLQKVKCPVLALNGSKDLQVSPKENLAGIKKALATGGNKNVTVKELPDLNHLFQEAETGSISEYGEIEQTFSPEALKIINDWILEQVK